MSAPTRSVLMLLITMLIWGSTFVVTKGVAAQIPPFTLAFARVAMGTLVLLPFAVLRQRWHAGPASSTESFPWLSVAAMGFVGVALYYALFNLSLLHTSAAQGALVQSSLPAVTALVAVVWLRERATTLRWVGIALSVIGVLVISSGAEGNGDDRVFLGNVLMFLTCICWGIYTSLAKRAAGFDPMHVTVGVTGAGALMLMPFSIWELANGGWPELGVRGWLAVVYLGVLASGFAYLFYNSALQHMDASQAGVYTNLIPVVGVVSGIVLLGEPLSARAIVGGCVVLVGVWLTTRSG